MNRKESKDHEQVKARRRAAVGEEERGGRVRRIDTMKTMLTTNHRIFPRELRKHRERKERERHDRRVKVAMGIFEPIDRLAGDGSLRGAVIHLEVAHAAAWRAARRRM